MTTKFKNQLFLCSLSQWIVTLLTKKKKGSWLKSGSVYQTSRIAGDKCQTHVCTGLPFITELRTLRQAMQSPNGSVAVYEHQEDEVEMNETWPANTHNTHRKPHWHEDLKIEASLRCFDSTFCFCSLEAQTPCSICTQSRPAALRLRCLNSPAVVLLLDYVCVLLPAILLILPCIPLCTRTAGSCCHCEFSAPSSHPTTNLLLFSLFPFSGAFACMVQRRRPLLWCFSCERWEMWFQLVPWQWCNATSLTRWSLCAFVLLNPLLLQRNL